MKQYIRDFWEGTQGQDLVEYSLIAALVSIASITILPVFGHTVSNIFGKINSTLASAVP